MPRASSAARKAASSDEAVACTITWPSVQARLSFVGIGRKGILGFRIIRNKSDIRIRTAGDQVEHGVDHLVGQLTQIGKGQRCAKLVDGSFFFGYRIEV